MYTFFFRTPFTRSTEYCAGKIQQSKPDFTAKLDIKLPYLSRMLPQNYECKTYSVRVIMPDVFSLYSLDSI